MWILFFFGILFLSLYIYTYPRVGDWLLFITQQYRMFKHGFSERCYRVNGMPIAALENNSLKFEGSRPLLIMVHGFSADKSVWLPLASKLKDQFHIVIPDLPGHGDTGYSPQWNYSVKAQAEILCSLIWQLGYQRAHVIGNSMGGHIAAWMARYHESSIASAVLLSPGGLPGVQKSKLDKLMEQGLNPFFVQERGDFRKLLALSMSRPPYMPSIVKDAMAQRYIAKRAQYEHIFRDYSASGYLNSSSMAKTRPPLFIIWGMKDALIHVSAMRNWSDTVPCATQVFHDLGHMPMLEAPKRIYYCLDHFYQKHKDFIKPKPIDKPLNIYRNIP
ncbi:alpha/beta hydrolase [Alteromonas pelagimontana]|uniref:Alpha/beta hydrolase n=1 Tax=Alteromonas pelagimontana TaxID=1858656 RepID=A0A6M4MHH2_9ALTE|nr:alpha/beta hydrolase [Alteromonas pelagimontana]QJR82651.1 alpha/beta hydrolase [Alteromonas pelagimontana]